ncbi:hypothetical protein DL93DRAFT_2162817 [Clavulina sp. PMI_390]|nr:hypothetical protein DL93DRAFT_2162817 [Clavulina sp. PMI_390]
MATAILFSQPVAFDAGAGIVKFQVITRDKEEITVGRLKIPTPGEGHAFILRRFDTQAISVSTMIRAAFPTLPDDIEKAETVWVRTAFDTAGANGSGARRLAGVWAPLEVAVHLAQYYQVEEIIAPLVNAVYDPKNIPRRSTRSSAAVAETNTAAAPPSPARAPSPGKAKTPPAKRRRAESPSAVPSSSGPATRRRSVGPSPARVTRSSASPARQLAPTPGGRRSLRSPRPPAVPEEADEHTDVDTPIAADAEREIEEAKNIVDAVKAAAALNDSPMVIDSVAVKRSREEEGAATLTLNIHQPREGETMEVARPIATNRRIQMTPSRKAAAWGAVLFGVGLGAV